MYRIHSLRLQYFKGFQTREPFAFEGRNVLLYGTNGSGKSSLYWALYTLLQPSLKPGGPTDAQHRYFGPYVPADGTTHQSLRNAYAPTLPTAGPIDEHLETALELECRDPDDSTAPVRRYRLSQTQAVGYDGPNANQLQETALASDFLYYRQLQDFSLTSNRRAVNLWPVFLRDLFPFDSKPGASGSASATFEHRLRELIASFPRKANGEPVSRGRVVYKEWEANAQQFNQDVGQYLDNLEQQANGLLNGAFGEGDTYLKIRFLWNPPFDITDPFRAHQFSGEVMRRLGNRRNTDEHLADLRADQPDELLISFRVTMCDKVGNEITTSDRPQSFLNEARLTRVALAVRIGALLARLQTADLKLLCLDDLLVSLDSSNRWLVMRWLFNPAAELGKKFQILFFTHDRELYRLMRHQIEVSRQERYWCYYELFANEDHKKEPSVLPTANAYMDRAQRAFHAMPPDFPSCANYLRKEVERLLKRLLPPVSQLKPKSGSDQIIERSMGELIKDMIELHRDHNEGLGSLAHLDLYRDLHLNPLSHDNPGTAIYQRELREIMDEIIPALASYRQIVLFPLNETSETYVELHHPEAADPSLIQKHLIRLYEPLRTLVFPSGKTIIPNLSPQAEWKGRLKDDGTVDESAKGPKNRMPLSKLYTDLLNQSRGKLLRESDYWLLLRISNARL